MGDQDSIALSNYKGALHTSLREIRYFCAAARRGDLDLVKNQLPRITGVYAHVNKENPFYPRLKGPLGVLSRGIDYLQNALEGGNQHA
ncbi:hypothetical protein CMI48_03495 [Candidatus Pacearchaeota archaeon]|nr:hypothetical protein [Candidatus Pacearchaeota archaeon]|tara:strand:+ start:110 stop:373 length:264 start_codon:yes stop_codon:yes gene_type:complete